MRRVVKTLLPLAFMLVLPAAAWAQAAIAGEVRDTSGGVLPGVTVEASSPALIEKVRTATTDSNGRYRIEDLRPGSLHRRVHPARLHHDAAGRAGDRRQRRHHHRHRAAGRRRPGNHHRHRRNAGRRRRQHQARDHARQRNDARAARRPQLQLPADDGSRPAVEHHRRQHRPGVRHLPGARRPRRRVAPHGRGHEHQQPAGRQPAAELHRRHRQRAGSHGDDVGRSRRVGNRPASP